MNNRFKKLIASLLAMIMLMSMLPVTTLDGIVAQAASDVIEITSPDDGSTIAGKKSLTVKWAKVTGADYYLFSARNLTTDAEIASRVDTGTTRSYKISASDLPYNNRFRFWVGAFDAAGNQIAGSDTNYEVNTYPIIDGYFGNNSYTMEPGETLDVKVNASVENANLTRATITIDSSGDDDHDHKDISGTDWSGYLTLDGNVYPLNIPGTYTVKLYVKVDAGDPNWAEVDRATLVVEEPCYHPAAEIEEYWDQTTGINHKSISDTLHRSSGYKYKYCGACLSRVGSSYAVTVDEAHIFDAAGDCTLCDYKASCQHPNTKPIVDTSYHNKGAEGHLVVQYGNLVCTNANCGKEVEPYYSEEMKAHTFSEDTCSLCGYTEYSEMKVVVARDQTSAETGNEISAKATVQGGSGVFSYAWEVLCDGVVVHRTDYSMSSEYSYTADKAGKWSFRVYVMDDNTEEEIIETSSDITVSEAACPHTNSTPVSQDTEYIKLSDTAHEIRTFYINFCDSCGESTSGTYYQSENVVHAPDSSGHCVCGYVVPTETCQHTESLPQQIDQWINPYDETWHSVVTVYKDVCANADCGVVLNAHREVDDKIAHSYDDAGKCVCGYVRPTDACDHAAADTLTDTSYTDLNESNHSVIRTYHYQCECGQVDYNDTKTTTEPHVFENGTCVCGRTEAVAITYGGSFSQDSYTMTVGEKMNVDVTASTTNANLSRVTINVDSTGNDRLAYSDINGGTNWNGTLTLDGANAPLNVPGTYTIKLFVKVNNDDNAWAEVDQATLTVAEAAGCPHTTVEEYWEMTEGYSVTYKSVSDTHHTASGHMYKFCTLCLSRVGDNYPVTIDEAHSFDAAGDCILCDYRVSCQHKETKPKVETSGYTSKGEEGHLFFQYGNLVCANANCGKEVEPYYAEELQDHTFSDNTCSLCGYSKAEELSVVVARGQSSAETGDIISATATAKGGSGSYKYAWEVICEGVVVNSTDYSMPSSYSYVADDMGSWTFKVYVKDASTGDVVTATTSVITVEMAACPHDLINSIQQGDPQYIKISDTTHEIRTYYNDTCGVCGDGTRADYYKSETAAHTLDANGKCVCGYTAPTPTCDHANSIPQQIGQPTVEKFDEKWHEVIYIYKDVCANEACQTVLNEHREVREMVVHAFDANGKCACGYVLPTEECDHVATKTELNPKYIAVDASCHHFTVTYHYECECGQVNYDEDAQSFDAHVYEGRICKLCGFENPCDHADFQKVISSVVEDDKNSNSTHFVVTTYTKTCECGAVNPTPIVRKTVPCSFTKSAGVQAKHESQGHQYFDRCACGNATVNGKYKSFLSSCKTCQEQNEEYKLIKELQTLLNNRGYNAGAIDGLWGPNTKNAMNKFRADVMGLGAIDYVDTATMQALRNNVKPDDQPIEQPESTNTTCKHDWFIKDDSGYAKHPHTVIFACKLCAETKSENTTKLMCCACGNGEHVWISTHPATSHKHPMVYKCSKCDEVLTEAPAYDAKCIACNPNNYQWPETPTSKDLEQNMATGEDYIAIRETDEFRDEYLYAPNGGVWESDITHFANGVGTGLSENMGVKSAVYKAVYISPEETEVLSVYMRQMQQIIANDTLQTWTLGLLGDLNILDGDMKSLTTGGDMVEDKVIEVLMESGYADSEVPLERLKELESMMALTPLDLPGVDAVLNTKDLTGWDLPDKEGGKVLDVIETALKWYDFVSTINYTYLAPIIENAAQNGNGLVYEYTVNFDSPIEMEWVSGKYTPTNNYAVAPTLGEWVGVDTDGDGVKEWYMSSEYDLYGTYEANPY